MTTVNKSKLRTDFICIATSGSTIDGREITKQELLDMAESYDPALYTANLWPDHKRWFNFGQVLELKAEEQENGEVKLFAVLAPNENLISWNKGGQYLFTSIEISPNFRNSGKNYLTGLGVTDTPASVGTTQLQFSTQSQATENIIAGQYQPITLTLSDAEQEKEKSFFNMMKEFFKKHEEPQQEQAKIPNNNNNKEEQSMDEKQFNQLLGALTGLTEKVEKHFSVQKPEQEPKQPETPKTEEPKQETGVTAEQFNQLIGAVTDLNKKFDALSTVQTPVPNGVPTAADNQFNMAV
ncbi:GPO family capsid scaffolding protein [Actinobacillus genomosp. 2]|uniref:GPO family capsid scaffolding protein n=1 Tax=Actinobacillus genomosp. 2 TaxID=230709 RepID=UPI002442A28B|nr:GPO family capsid scaffolding protein [Actinobacillus genomosp. 2]WGE32544.1 GPO family capsid scaffolding protein [Actinobacillus genomosp. 2]